MEVVDLKPLDKRKQRLKARNKQRLKRRRERRGKMLTEAFDMRTLRALIVPADPMEGH